MRYTLMDLDIESVAHLRCCDRADAFAIVDARKRHNSAADERDAAIAERDAAIAELKKEQDRAGLAGEHIEQLHRAWVKACRERDAAIALGRAEREAARLERESLIEERDEARDKYAKLADRFWDKSIPPVVQQYRCRCLPIAQRLDDEWIAFTPADVIAQMKAISEQKRDREVAATITPRTVDPATGIVWSEEAKRAKPKSPRDFWYGTIRFPFERH